MPGARSSRPQQHAEIQRHHATVTPVAVTGVARAFRALIPEPFDNPVRPCGGRRKKECLMSPESPAAKPPSTLGLTGLTVNAMALIAPGAFLWLTFFIQSAYGQPMAAQGMWFGIFAAVLLCLATAI